MNKVTLGRTGITVNEVAMGCLPIQRVTKDEAVRILRRAYDGGVQFFDTAHVYTDSEEKMGAAFDSAMRKNIIIASKTMSTDYDTTMKQIDQSLRMLHTDYIDIYQWHNPSNPEGAENDENSPYAALVEAKRQGKIRFIGITNHHLGRATAAVESGLYDTVQYPFSMLSSEEEVALTRLCKEKNVGFLAMKAMCGGLLEDGRAPFAYMHRLGNVLPLWGVQRISEIEQFLSLAENPPAFDADMAAQVEQIRAENGNEFCRGCGYCMPCPKGINLPTVMRIEFFVKRNRPEKYLGEEYREMVDRVDECVKCGRCKAHCPYHLDIPARIVDQKEAYMELYRQFHAGEPLRFRSKQK